MANDFIPHRPDLPSIYVYEDSPEWETVSKWFDLPLELLRKLFVTRWDVMNSDEVTEEHADYVRSQYNRPVVLVY